MSIPSLPIRFVASIVAASTVAISAPPAARIVPYTQTFYGTVRSDPYHWMEAGGPDLKAYIERQTRYTTALLDSNPGRSKVRAELREAYSSAGASTIASGVTRVGARVYYLQNLAGSDSPSLLMRADGRKRSSVIVAAKALPKDAVIGWFAPSPNGSKIAYGATASSEIVVIHVCNADGSHDSAQAIEPSVIPYAAWHGERAFYYPTTRASATNRTEESFLHVVGAAKGSDAPIGGFGVSGPLGSRTSRDLFSTYTVLGKDAVVATIQHDVTSHQAVFIAPFASATRATGPWRRLFGFDDQIVSVAVGARYAYGLTDRGNPRRAIVIRDRRTGRTVRTIRPTDGYRMNVFANRTGFYVAERVGAEMRVRHFDAAGRARETLALPPVNAVNAIDGDPETNSFALETSSFNDPGRWYEISGPRATIRTMIENSPVPSLYAHIRYVDDFATSADGTRIPYTTAYRLGTPKDGMRPTVVFGYGAYGYDIEPPVPTYVAALTALGVVVVLAHARGGGEFGEAWHFAGKGPRKQHTIDDFVACAKAAIDGGWTSPTKLAAFGGSAGAITVGGAITQHPGLFAVALSQVGFNDMVDLENMPNGPGNVPEFGSVKTRAGFRDLLAMSAYDHVIPAAYPAMILTTGFGDQRTAPWQVAKMHARLQASTTSGKPVLLRADAQGHGIVLDASSEIEEYADIYTFLLWQVGEPGFAPM